MNPIFSTQQQDFSSQKSMMEDHRGQSTIEFLLSFIFAVGFLTLFIHYSINSAVGFIVHYATYQSARTYLVYDVGSNSAYKEAEKKATNVFNTLIPDQNNFYIDQGAYGIFNHFKFPYPDRQGKLYVGVWFKFRQRFSIYSLFGKNLRANMVSEAFLGKEPSREQCRERICTIMRLKTSYNSCASPFNAHNTVFDNGC